MIAFLPIIENIFDAYQKKNKNSEYKSKDLHFQVGFIVALLRRLHSYVA